MAKAELPDQLSTGRSYNLGGPVYKSRSLWSSIDFVSSIDLKFMCHSPNYMSFYSQIYQWRWEQIESGGAIIIKYLYKQKKRSLIYV